MGQKSGHFSGENPIELSHRATFITKISQHGAHAHGIPRRELKKRDFPSMAGLWRQLAERMRDFREGDWKFKL